MEKSLHKIKKGLSLFFTAQSIKWNQLAVSSQSSLKWFKDFSEN